MTKWTFLGSGTYNTAYVNEKQSLVFKVQKTLSVGYAPKTDWPERSVRLWNEINDNYEPKAYLFTDDSNPPKMGWVCPFIKGGEPWDCEISTALLDIFNRTGRIVLDAYVPGNFKKDKHGKIVCVDIGLAFQLQKKEETVFAGRPRRHSTTSVTHWDGPIGQLKDLFNSFPLLGKLYRPQTINTTKALLFIKEQCPDIFNVDFLKINKSLIRQLASAYDKSLNSHSPSAQASVTRAIEALRHEKPLTVEHLHESCKVELERYIQSRGSLDKKGTFSPSLRTQLFRNEALTAQKVDVAKELIKNLECATTLAEINETIEAIKTNPDHISRGILASDFLSQINKCLYIADCPELVANVQQSGLSS